MNGPPKKKKGEGYILCLWDEYIPATERIVILSIKKNKFSEEDGSFSEISFANVNEYSIDDSMTHMHIYKKIKILFDTNTDDCCLFPPLPIARLKFNFFYFQINI